MFYSGDVMLCPYSDFLEPSNVILKRVAVCINNSVGFESLIVIKTKISSNGYEKR